MHEVKKCAECLGRRSPGVEPGERLFAASVSSAPKNGPELTCPQTGRPELPQVHGVGWSSGVWDSRRRGCRQSLAASKVCMTSGSALLIGWRALSLSDVVNMTRKSGGTVQKFGGAGLPRLNQSGSRAEQKPKTLIPPTSFLLHYCIQTSLHAQNNPGFSPCQPELWALMTDSQAHEARPGRPTPAPRARKGAEICFQCRNRKVGLHEAEIVTGHACIGGIAVCRKSGAISQAHQCQWLLT